MIFGVHIGRLMLTTLLSGVMWHSALPAVSMGWLLILATLQLLVTRLPFVPNKDLVFASVALFLIGHDGAIGPLIAMIAGRSEEHTSELQSLMRISSAVFCLKTKNKT